MHKLAQLESRAYILSKEIDQYFKEKGFNIDKLRCGNGISLEELEYGNDITDEFCKNAEEDFSNRSIWVTEVRVQ